MTNASNTRIESHTAEANGQSLHYLIAGDGPLLLLLHGWPQHSHHWRTIMPALAEHFTVVAPDLRGSGGSTKPRTGYVKRELAADMHALIAGQFGDQKISLCGYDWGANVAYAYAACGFRRCRPFIPI
jgi:haloacetate dehalogenase